MRSEFSLEGFRVKYNYAPSGWTGPTGDYAYNEPQYSGFHHMNAAAYEEDLGEDRVDFGSVLKYVRTKVWWIVSSVVVFTASFTAWAFLATPRYHSSTVLAPAAVSRSLDAGGIAGQLGGLASVAGLGVGPRDAQTEEALAVLRSREFTERFIDSHKLLPKLFDRKWDAATGNWKVGERPPTLAMAYKRFDKKIRSVIQDKKTGLVTLQIDWRDRNEAAAWANELVRLLNEEMRARAVTEADASVQFLEKELDTTSTVETRGAIGKLMESEVKQRMLAHVTQDYSFRVVDKALPPDPDDTVGPTRLMLLAVGPMAGLVFGFVAVMALGRAQRWPS